MALEGRWRRRGVIFMIAIVLAFIQYHHHNPKAGSMVFNIPSLMGGNKTGENDTCLSTGLAAKSELRECVWDSLPLLGPHVDPNNNEVPIFVLHKKTAHSRKTRLVNLFSRVGITTRVHWIEGHSPGNMTSQVLQCLFDPSDQTNTSSKLITWIHYCVFRWMVEFGVKNVIVMEDDPVFNDQTLEQSFGQDLHRVVELAPPGFDMVHFGGCLGIHIPQRNVDEHGFGVGQFSRCANGYAISRNGAKKMMALLRKGQSHIKDHIDFPIDHGFNYIGGNGMPGCSPLQVYLTEPHLYDNGSNMKDRDGNPIIVSTNNYR